MASRERKDREPGELRTRILDSARELILREGCDAVSMRKIADAIDYSATAIYGHFKDKQTLLRELCNHDFARLSEELWGLTEISDPIERVRQMGLVYIRFALEHPSHYRLMFMTLHHHDFDDPEALEQRKGHPDVDGYAFLVQTVAAGMEARRYREDLNDADLIAQTYWAGVHGVASLQIAKGADPWLQWRDVETRARTMGDALLRGLTRAEGVGS
jgi:AcrR family transcriptional regulator